MSMVSRQVGYAYNCKSLVFTFVWSGDSNTLQPYFVHIKADKYMFQLFVELRTHKILLLTAFYFSSLCLAGAQVPSSNCSLWLLLPCALQVRLPRVVQSQLHSAPPAEVGDTPGRYCLLVFHR
jgi:hypothetical protein